MATTSNKKQTIEIVAGSFVPNGVERTENGWRVVQEGTAKVVFDGVEMEVKAEFHNGQIVALGFVGRAKTGKIESIVYVYKDEGQPTYITLGGGVKVGAMWYVV